MREKLFRRTRMRCIREAEGTVILGVIFFLFGILFTDKLSADESRYEFRSVMTILGPCCGDSGSDLVVDDDGGVFVAGSRGGLDLNRDGVIDVPTYGSPDPMIFKFFDNGSSDGWVRGPGGPERDAGKAIALDGQGGAYMVGHFEELMHVADAQITSMGRRDGFLVRYDKHGNSPWVIAVGGEGYDDLMDVASDSKGNVYVTGVVQGPVDVDRDGSIDVTPTSGSAMLLASFDPQGTLRWAHVSAGEADATGLALATGPGDELYVGGFYRNGRIDLDADGEFDGPVAGGSTNVTPQSDLNAFYARFDTDGSMQWARFVSGPAVQIIATLAVAGNGDLIVGGGMTDSADLDGDGVPDIEFKSMGESKWEHHADGNTFLLRVNPQGERIWVRRYMAAAAHVTAQGGRIVISGSYNGVLDIDDDGVAERQADPDDELEGFIAILDAEGVVQQVFTVVGGDSDVVAATGFSPDGKKLYATGYTKLGADFDGDGKVESASLCHQLGDVYLATYALKNTP
jgi:hypothetical protein